MPGKTEIEQIRMIFSLLGTPNEKIWYLYKSFVCLSFTYYVLSIWTRPGYSQLPHVKTVAFIHQP